MDEHQQRSPTWAEDFAQSRNRQHAASAAACGLAALAYITVIAHSGESLAAQVLVLALLIVPGWYLLHRIQRALTARLRRKTWVWATTEHVIRWHLLRAAFVGLKLLTALVVGLPATAVCLVMALVPTRRYLESH